MSGDGNFNNEEGTDKLVAPADFNGPSKERKCTDVLCSLLVVIMWAVMTGIGLHAVRKGDYRVVVYPMDYAGHICGIEYNGTDMRKFPKLLYLNNMAGGVCVEECPKVANLTDIHTLVTYDGVWQGSSEDATVPVDFVKVANYSSAENRRSCENNANECTTDIRYSWTSPAVNKAYGFAFYAVNTFDILGGTRCLNDPEALKKVRTQVFVPDDNILNVQALDTSKAIMRNLYSDLYIAREYLMISFGVAMAIGLCYSYLLRVKCILPILVWFSILGTIAMFFGSGVYTFKVANDWDNAVPKRHESTAITAAKITAVVLFVIGALLLVVTIFMRKQLQLAMSCVKEAARAIAAQKLIMFLPILTTLGFFAFAAVWLYYAVHVASLGTLGTKQLPFDSVVTVRTFDFEPQVERFGWYLIFCFFWSSGLISAIGSIITAMSISKWYFTRDKKAINSCTVITSIQTTIRYHVGTAAFGSLIIAIIQLIRAFLAKLQKKAKQMDSKCAQAILCCCQCLVYCFEKFMKFINKNAYIQTAIFGTPFCTSAKQAFFLILRNALRIGSIGYVSALVVFVGKMFISIITTGLVYMAMEQKIDDQVHSLFAPVLFVFFIAYFVADMFMDLFDMSTSTILQCFIADEEMFSGDQTYAERKMHKFLDKYEKSERSILVRGP